MVLWFVFFIDCGNVMFSANSISDAFVKQTYRFSHIFEEHLVFLGDLLIVL